MKKPLVSMKFSQLDAALKSAIPDFWAGRTESEFSALKGRCDRYLRVGNALLLAITIAFFLASIAVTAIVASQSLEVFPETALEGLKFFAFSVVVGAGFAQVLVDVSAFFASKFLDVYKCRRLSKALQLLEERSLYENFGLQVFVEGPDAAEYATTVKQVRKLRVVDFSVMEKLYWEFSNNTWGARSVAC